MDCFAIEKDHTWSYRSNINRTYTLEPSLKNAHSGNRVEERDVIPRFFQLAQPYRVKLPVHSQTFPTAARIIYDVYGRRFGTVLKDSCGFIAREGSPSLSMASEKRKRVREEATRPNNDRPEKKPKTSKPVSKLVVPKEEPAFQRGGASILTPLEQKQIQVQATRDALFEQSTGQKARNTEFGDDENEQDEIAEPTAALAKTKRRNPKRPERNGSMPGPEDSGIRIEALSYKRLVPGSMVLGQISQINRNDVALHLPNNLTGYLPLTSISDRFTEGLETTIAENDEGRDNDDSGDLNLKKYFFVGQYLRAYVVSTTDDRTAAGKSRRHIELSINPRQANLGLKKSDLVLGSIVQAAVASVEDHGLVMDLGLEDGAIRGFVSSKQLGHNVALSSMKEGTVFLCLITNQKTNSKVINLSADLQTAGSMKKDTYLTDAPSVDSYLPGTATEILVTETAHNGIVGKAMGVLDVTADLIHSGAAASGKGLDKKYPIGSKVKGRIVCTFPTSEQKKIGISLLDHVVHLKPKRIASQTANEVPPMEVIPLSTIVAEAKVAKVDPRLGLFVDIGVKGIRGFVHISSVSDKMIETLPESTGPYKLGSSHKARITGYNSMDALFIASLQEKIIDQPFLRLEDVEVGQVVQGTIDRIIVGATGVTGLLVSVAEGISGLVPDVHFADVVLQHPEKKFKEGGKVTARVLSTDLEKRQMRLTLKKTLVNSEAGCWKSYDELKPGMQCPGTIINVISSGAVIQFYGSVRGFLPVSEMSESYIQDPKQHFRNGQVVNVNIVSVDPSEGRMIVSCKDPTAFSEAQQEALRMLKPGDIVNATVSEKTSENIVLELEASAVKALLPIEHLADGSAQKSSSVAKKIRVNQTMTELLVLSKDESKHLARLSSKPSLLQVASNGTLLKEFGDVVEGNEYQGFVKNITSSAVFVQFAGEMTGLLPKSQLPDEVVQTSDFGLRRNQSIKVRILSVDYQLQRFLLTTKPPVNDAKEQSESKARSYADTNLSNPVDLESKTLNDFSFGRLTKARITSVKDTQLNVELADGVQGRIDVSQLFDAWADFKDHKHPTKAFHKQQIIPVRILGMHDSRNHRFLPITHRGRAPVFELSAKSSEVNGEGLEVLTLDKVKIGSDHVVFVNNVAADCIWVNLSPNVRGRIKAMDASDNVSLLRDLPKNFPIGSALKAKVTHVDIENNRLDLSARSGGSSKPMSLKDLSVGMVLPGRVTKVTERLLMVQLNDTISGPVQLVDLVDDYSKANPTEYEKNQTIRVCIKAIDRPNKKVYLSARPSKVLSSSLPVKDRDISSITQIEVNDILRGFVKNVADNGVFVSLSSNVTAYVRVADLSDAYLKDWKSDFETDQLVQGRIIAVNPELNHVQMSLRKSHLDKNYKALLMFPDMKVGQTVTGKIRNIQDFGVFVVVDGSENVSGLCHRSELSDQKGADPRKLYNEGDAVQARVLKIEPANRRISFGLKASYFISEDSDEAEDGKAADDEFSGISEVADDGDSEMDGVEIDGVQESESDLEIENGRVEGGVEVPMPPNGGPHKSSATKGLSAGFDWDGTTLAEADFSDAHSDTDNEIAEPKKKRRRKAEIKIDRTGDLDVNGPQSIADFERLLLGQPHSSFLWLSYMAFQLELSEIDQARQIAERALKTINMREQEEKLNVWVALLNLENTYGSEESLDEVFKRACHYNDNQDIHERLISIYIQSGANEKADDLFQAALKKHTQTPALYLNNATFLLTTLNAPTRARALLPRALQALPPHTHLDITSKFAQLEFTSPNGDAERGRTMFEGLLSKWPKRLDLWNVLLDLEMGQGEGGEKIARVRGVFERIVKGKLNGRKAKWAFKRWLEFEEGEGDGRGQESVKAKAAEYAKMLEREKGERSGG